MTTYDQGLQRFKELMGEEALEALKKIESVSPDLIRYIIEFGYGDLFCRKGLTDKIREVAIVGCLFQSSNI